MTIEEAFEKSKHEIIGDNLTITSLTEAEELYDKFIQLRQKLSIVGLQIIDVMPHSPFFARTKIISLANFGKILKITKLLKC